MTEYTSDNTSNPSFQPRVIKRITRTLPDGTVEVEEHYEQYVVKPYTQPTYPTVQPLTPQPPFWLGNENHSCPLTDPANEGKAMLYYCPICSGVQC